MAELVYDKDGRLLFTEEMKRSTPAYADDVSRPFHKLKHVLELICYKAEPLTTNHCDIVDEGLKFVHNDTC